MVYSAVAEQAMRRCGWCVGARRTAVAMALVLLAMSLDVAHGVRKAPAAGSAAGAVNTGETAAAVPPPSAASGSTLYADEGQAGKAAAAAREEEEEAVTGSRLPDCTHACGACSPCKRVMVSFRCAEAAESCPVAYRCMCRGRFFHVPTL